MSNSKQRVKINNTFSSWKDLIQGVPQGSVLSVLVRLLLNIYLNDLFVTLKNTDSCNFADDATPYICNNNIDKVLNLLRRNI